MAGVNKVILLGHVGHNPELKYTSDGGVPVTTISLATTEHYKSGRDGSRAERTDWHRVVFWRGLAEIVCEYVCKGRLIYVEGRLQTRRYQKDGVDHFSVEVVARVMQICDKREPIGERVEADDEIDVDALGPPLVIGGEGT